METIKINGSIHPISLILLLTFITASIIFIGILIGMSIETSKVKVEEPEVYAHFLQRLESISEIESFDLERDRFSGHYTYWTLRVWMNDEASFHYNKLESVEEINESIDKIEQYVQCIED